MVRAVPGVAVVYLLAGLGTAAPLRGDEPQPFRVPEGFEVTLYADDDLAHNIYSLTIDSQGRVVVAGPGYIKTLHDDDGDGRADRFTLFADLPASGAHGMLFDGPDLICTGDQSVRRLRDRDGDGRADDQGEIWARLHHSEHGANGLVRGPDGHFYLVCGNNAGVSRAEASLEGSPVADPRCGAIVRFTPDGKHSDAFAHGFRNPYDLDFNASGHLFTVDSDNEREYGLPWYAPTRLFDVAQGREHGWLLEGWQRSFNRPASFFDSVERLVEFGRGSPTGLVVYRHRQFPPRFRGGVFSCCWTFGRVYHVALQRAEATYRGQVETFLETTGTVGFAPVDLAVGPEGDLFIAVGGRGTRGGVFRVRYLPSGPVAPPEGSPLRRVLAADQPLSSWSRARWVPLAEKIGPQPLESVVNDRQADEVDQVRAVEILVDLFDGLTLEVIRDALALERPLLAARVAWALGRKPHLDETLELLAELTRHADPRVALAAWEAWATRRSSTNDRVSRAGPLDMVALAPDFDVTWAADARVRGAAWRVAARDPIFPDRLQRNGSDQPHGKLAAARHRLFLLWTQAAIDDETGALPSTAPGGAELLEVAAVAAGPLDLPTRIEAVRLLQVLLGDLRVAPGQLELYSGYAANASERIDATARRHLAAALASAFPVRPSSGDRQAAADAAETNRELARLLGMLSADDPALSERVASRLEALSSPQDDIHYLIVLSRLPAPWSAAVRSRSVDALVRLHGKMAVRRIFPDRNWPARMTELFVELCRRDGTLAEDLAAHEEFGRPEHSLFARAMQGQARMLAARRLLAAADEADEDEVFWTADLVHAVASLPDKEALPRLREQWSQLALRDAIVAALAQRPAEDDRGRFVEALGSPQAEVVIQAAEALRRLDAAATGDEVAAAVKALKQYCAAAPYRQVRTVLARLLGHWSGRNFAAEQRDSKDGALLAVYQPCFEWFERTYPEHAERMAGFSGADATAWSQRLAALDLSGGDAIRGKAVFEKRACHRCHTGGGRLGPDLAGAADRFSASDLFVAIVDPSKDVAPLYQTTLVATRSGQVYHGLIVYESAEGTLLQTGPDTTVRITGDDVLVAQPSRQSIMPTGLLGDATDQDLADLYAYLKTLRK